MINRLIIKDAIVFDEIDLNFQNGFNVFSGASGSGKSVLMESLLGIFGLKDSNASLLEAQLDIDLNEFGVDMSDFGIIEEGEDLILSIIKKDKTRYFINRYGSSKKRLNELVGSFGKHISSKGAKELSQENILRIFDDFISQDNLDHKKNLIDFRNDFSELKELKNQLQTLESEEKNLQSLKEFAEFEIQKIKSLNPKEGEYEKLLEVKKSLSKREKIQESLKEAFFALDEISKIKNVFSLIEEDSSFIEDAIFEARSILEEKKYQLEELSELNPEEILDRITALSELNRRYGSVSEALLHLKTQEEKLIDYQNITFNKEQLIKNIANLENQCTLKADQISQERQEKIENFSSELCKICLELLLKEPKLNIIKTPLNESGLEKIELKLATSSIETLSSGEYNRLRLVIMCIDASINNSKGILVLDEIDANLSGEESEGVAKILKRLSLTYQIFAISHQPHMPALADNHYVVFKQGDKSKVSLLDKEGRIKEMARMISGANITQEALDFARKRLEE